jgi:predicted ester cyclase
MIVTRRSRYHRRVQTSRIFRLRRLALAAWLPVLALLAACGGAADGTNADAITADKARVAEYLRTFLIQRDWPRWPDYFAPNAQINGSDLGLQILRGSADGLNYSFSGLELTIAEQIAEPGHVATSFVLEGLHAHPFNDQPATNKRLRIDGYSFDRFENGKIVDTRLFIDVWGLAERARLAQSGR